MKIIDLITYYSKGKELPEKIKIRGKKFKYDGYLTYVEENSDGKYYFFSDDYDWCNWLDDEIEIIEDKEDNSKIEKIKITDDKYIFNTITNSYNQPTSWGYFLANKINEIIDKLEVLDNDSKRDV